MAKKKPPTKKKAASKPKPAAKSTAKPSAKKKPAAAKKPATPKSKKAPAKPTATKSAPAKSEKKPKAEVTKATTKAPSGASKKKAPKSKAPEAKAKSPATPEPKAKPAPAAKTSSPKAGAKGPSAKSAPAAKPAPSAKGGKTKSGRGGKPAVPTKSDAETFAEAQAAAARLAAIAGIRPIESRPFDDPSANDDSKRLTKSPLSKKELTHYRDLLTRKRSEIMGDVESMEDEALMAGDRMSHTPNHMAEQGSDVYGQTLSLDIAASQRKLVFEIEQALQRIAEGTYGICVIMGTPIGKARLDAKPWAKHCIEAARRLERGGSLA